MSKRGDIYREIPVTIWDRQDFRDLSVNAKALVLYFYMLSGPHSTLIPGLFRAGKAALAEGLRWPFRADAGTHLASTARRPIGTC